MVFFSIPIFKLYIVLFSFTILLPALIYDAQYIAHQSILSCDNDNGNEITLFRHIFIIYRTYFYEHIRVINVSNQNIYVPRRP